MQPEGQVKRVGKSPCGKGGGIWKPDETQVASADGSKPTIVYAEIPQ